MTFVVDLYRFLDALSLDDKACDWLATAVGF